MLEKTNFTLYYEANCLNEEGEKIARFSASLNKNIGSAFSINDTKDGYEEIIDTNFLTFKTEALETLNVLKNLISKEEIINEDN